MSHNLPLKSTLMEVSTRSKEDHLQQIRQCQTKSVIRMVTQINLLHFNARSLKRKRSMLCIKNREAIQHIFKNSYMIQVFKKNNLTKRILLSLILQRRTDMKGSLSLQSCSLQKNESTLFFELLKPLLVKNTALKLFLGI